MKLCMYYALFLAKVEITESIRHNANTISSTAAKDIIKLL